MELADVVDSKSTGSDTVPVRVRPPAPTMSQRTDMMIVFVLCDVFYDQKKYLSDSFEKILIPMIYFPKQVFRGVKMFHIRHANGNC